MPQMGIQPIPAQTVGPLPPGTIGLVLGRGSLALQGLIVHPGLVEAQRSLELSLQSSFQLSLTVLVGYRSRAGI